MCSPDIWGMRKLNRSDTDYAIKSRALRDATDTLCSPGSKESTRWTDRAPPGSSCFRTTRSRPATRRRRSLLKSRKTGKNEEGRVSRVEPRRARYLDAERAVVDEVIELSSDERRETIGGHDRRGGGGSDAVWLGGIGSVGPSISGELSEREELRARLASARSAGLDGALADPDVKETVSRTGPKTRTGRGPRTSRPGTDSAAHGGQNRNFGGTKTLILRDRKPISTPSAYRYFRSFLRRLFVVFFFFFRSFPIYLSLCSKPSCVLPRSLCVRCLRGCPCSCVRVWLCSSDGDDGGDSDDEFGLQISHDGRLRHAQCRALML